MAFQLACSKQTMLAPWQKACLVIVPWQVLKKPGGSLKDSFLEEVGHSDAPLVFDIYNSMLAEAMHSYYWSIRSMQFREVPYYYCNHYHIRTCIHVYILGNQAFQIWYGHFKTCVIQSIIVWQCDGIVHSSFADAVAGIHPWKEDRCGRGTLRLWLTLSTGFHHATWTKAVLPCSTQVTKRFWRTARCHQRSLLSSNSQTVKLKTLLPICRDFVCVILYWYFHQK